MAHELETFTNGATAFVSARKSAWHSLGTTLDDAFTAEQAMNVALLGGWNVRKTPLVATEIDADGVESIDVPARFATVRTNPVTGKTEALGVVGANYQPIQNEEHAAFLNALTDQSGAVFETAGSLRGGRQTFITMKLPETMVVGGSDRVDLNIAAMNSHDGSMAFRVVVTPIRVVCANTLAASLRHRVSSWSIRHTRNATSAIDQARQALDLSFEWFGAFELEAERMIQQSMTDAEFDKLIESTFGKADADSKASEAVKERDAKLHHLFADADTNAGIRGTSWAGYNAITEYLDHFSKVRAVGEAAGPARALRAVTNDDIARLKVKAFDLASI